MLSAGWRAMWGFAFLAYPAGVGVLLIVGERVAAGVVAMLVAGGVALGAAGLWWWVSRRAALRGVSVERRGSAEMGAGLIGVVDSAAGGDRGRAGDVVGIAWAGRRGRGRIGGAAAARDATRNDSGAGSCAGAAAGTGSRGGGWGVGAREQQAREEGLCARLCCAR